MITNCVQKNPGEYCAKNVCHLTRRNEGSIQFLKEKHESES